MTPIINFISHFHQSILLIVYLILSFIFIVSSDSTVVEGMRSSSLTMFGVMQETIDDMGSYFNLSKKNSELRKENTRLAYENYHLQDALLENMRLRKLLQFKYEVNYELIPAKVIGYSPHDIVTGRILSSEEIANTAKNSAVMTADGLVGKIVKVSGDYAICQILLDPNSRVSAKVQRNRQLGMIKSDGANGYILDHVPNTITIIEGDVIFTSGLSQIYPANIKIGVVNKIEHDEKALFQKIFVTPAVNYSRLEEVFIYKNK
ncbi:MAG: rod shape-determining protein MreC [Calditrichaeota bacterium]|nr:rod shape-determining protein MreC [Calditrichota bacterium]